MWGEPTDLGIVGGATAVDNLCLSCPTCNRYKAARQTGLDPFSEKSVPLFHPRKQSWHDHFAWRDNGALIEGLTPIGRATVDALRMNRPVLVQIRRYWVATKTHPPR